MASTENPSSGTAAQNHDDVHMSFADQQKINQFAKYNARMDELKIDLENKRAYLKNIEEAYEELELTDDDDDDCIIPFQFGEVFRSLKLSETREMLNDLKTKNRDQIGAIEATVHTLKTEMNELKAQLYQRFGSNISLENEE